MKTPLDLEAKLEKGIEDKEARDAGWNNGAELDAYLSIPRPTKNTLFGGNDNEWILHNLAMGEDSKEFDEHIIEDVQVQPNGEMRGMLTNKLYTAKEAIMANEKYDRNFTNPEFGKDKQKYLTAQEKVLANFNPTEALEYTNGGRDKENVQYMRYVKAKARRIDNLANTKNKKPKLENLKTALLTEEQKKDPKIIEVPFGQGFEEEIKKYEKENSENKDEDYKIKLPRNPDNSELDRLVLQSDLERYADRVSGIGQFDGRARYAGGGNGSTPKTPQTYQKQIEDLYGIQLTGQETIAELLELVKELKNGK